MKKLAITALVSIFAVLSFVPTVDAGRRGNPGFHNNWFNRGHDGRDCVRYCGWHGDYWRDGYWDDGYGGPEYWGGGGYYGGPVYMYDPYVYGNYCYVRQVRRYDQWGNLYIRRVRVCR